jgi:hypothetical protein
MNPDYGQEAAWGWAGDLAALVPADVDRIAYPPASRERMAGGFYSAGEPAVATTEALTMWLRRDVHLCRPLRWAREESLPPEAKLLCRLVR